LSQEWLYRYEQRHSWIAKGVNSYLETVKEKSVRDLIQASMGGTVAVSVYGETQVGKTTLILKLLGIKEEDSSKLNSLLRCGSRHGNSATPTAMIYRRSNNEKFHYLEPNQPRITLDEADLKAKLTQLRHRVEKNAYSDLSEVVIDIPNSKFDEDRYSTDIQIIDLPGFGSRNQKEQKHIEKILKKYLPISTMILVITKAQAISQVAQLFENGMLNELYGWRYMSSKYRLIVTWSYSGEADTHLGKQKSLSTDEVIRYYREEIRTKKNNYVPEDIGIYPFEIGGSWEEFKRQHGNSQYFHSVEMIQSELWDMVKNDIRKSSGQMAHIKSMKMVPDAIQKVKEDRIKSIEDQIKQNEEAVKNHEAEIKNRDILLGRNSEKRAEIEKAAISIGTYKIQVNDYNGDLNRNDMLDHISSMLSLVKNGCRKYETFCNNLRFSPPTLFDENKIVCDVRKRLEKIIFNKPHLFGKVGPKSEEKEAVNQSMRKLNQELKNWLDKTKDIYIDSMQETFKKIDNSDHVLSMEKTFYKAEISKGEIAIGDLHQQIKKTTMLYDREKDRVNELTRHLSESIYEEIQNKIRGLSNHTPLESLYDIFYCILIAQEYNILLTLNM
jgi:GTPase SAR1 family protein